MMAIAKIKFVRDTFGNDKGDIVRVKKETEKEVYYYDSFGRWCYLLKSEEGAVYLYIPGRDPEKEQG